jgi:V/A-type H+-transporting ATPase subunit F
MKETTGKIAAIGTQDIIEPLKMVGVDIFPVTKTTVKEILLEVVNEGYAVVLIGEDCIEGIEEFFLKLSMRPMPSIVPIPGKGKSRNFAYHRLRELIKKAVGTDIRKEES